jgi:hypothetical protein
MTNPCQLVLSIFLSVYITLSIDMIKLLDIIGLRWANGAMSIITWALHFFLSIEDKHLLTRLNPGPSFQL